MQAIVLREIGGPQNLHVEEIETPVAGPGEILVRIRCAAFNRRDVFITQGLYPGIAFPVIPGSDGCGSWPRTVRARADRPSAPRS